MSFDFMKNMVHWEDEERFGRLCEAIEDVIREAEAEARATEMVSQAIAKGDINAVNYFVATRYVESLEKNRHIK